MSGSTSQQSKSPMSSSSKRDLDTSPKPGSSQQTHVGENSSQQRTSTSSMADFGSQQRLQGSLEPDDLDDQRSRNHSLKYSKGALTGNSVQVHFDETVLIPKTSHDPLFSQRPMQQQQQQQHLQLQQKHQTFATTASTTMSSVTTTAAMCTTSNTSHQLHEQLLQQVQSQQ